MGFVCFLLGDFFTDQVDPMGFTKKNTHGISPHHLEENPSITSTSSNGSWFFEKMFVSPHDLYLLEVEKDVSNFSFSSQNVLLWMCFEEYVLIRICLSMGF